MFNSIMERLRNKALEDPDLCLFRVIRSSGTCEDITAKMLLDRISFFSKTMHSYKDAICAVYLPPSIDLFAFLLASFLVHCIPIIRRVRLSDLEAINDDHLLLENAILPDLYIYPDDCTIPSEIKNAYNIGQLPPANKRFPHKDYDFIQLSSGTTGAPKGVCWTSQSLSLNAETEGHLWEINENSVVMTYVSFSHLLGFINGFIVPLYHGCKCVVVEPEYISSKNSSLFFIVEQERVTFTSMIIETLYKEIQSKERHDLSSLSCIMLGGERVSSSMFSQLKEGLSLAGASSCNLYNSYGMSECGFVTSMYASNNQKKEQIFCAGEVTVGSTESAHTSVCILTDDNTVATENAIGRIAVFSKAMTTSYIANKNQKKLRYIFIDNKPYFISNDMGFISEGNLFICGRETDTITYNGQKYSPGYLLDFVLSKLLLQEHIKDALLFNIPNTLNTIVFFYESDNKLSFEQEKAIYELFLEAFQIKISEFYFGTIYLTSDLKKKSYQKTIRAYLNSKIYDADTEENPSNKVDRYASSVGVLKKEGEQWFARTVEGDLKLNPPKYIVMPDLIPEELYRFYYKDSVVVFADHLSLQNITLTKTVNGHHYQVIPFDQVPKEDVEKLQDSFHSIDERIIPTVLNLPYPEFYKKATEMKTWDCSAPIVGALILFLYYDGEIVGAIDHRYALSEKLRYYGGHAGGAIMPQFRNRRFASAFLPFSLLIAKHLGYPKLRITCRHTNEKIRNIMKKENGFLIRSYSRTDTIIEDVYDITI